MLKRKRSILPLLIAFISLWGSLNAREFTVMAYNVNNLFDVDGVSQFHDFRQGSQAGYTPEKLLTKIRNIAKLVKTVNDGQGPDIILFQEIEYDMTSTAWPDYAAFLEKYKHTTVDAMLTSEFNKEIADLSAHELLYKYFEDNELAGYHISHNPKARPEPMEKKPHVNITFTRFPIEYSKAYPIENARDILETAVNVDGNTLILFNNHWKSGASNTKYEQTRRQNAQVLRNRLDEIKQVNPHADIIIGGDLNSHYNQSERYPEMQQNTGINDILGSQGYESKVAQPNGEFLYNLWYELPPEERKSDYYQGEWGTLMHIIVSRGLYDYMGIQYIDNSYEVIAVKGLNAEKLWKLPVRAHLGGKTGGGFSDHFPILARFRTVSGEDLAKYMTLQAPGKPSGQDTLPVRIDYNKIDPQDLLVGAALDTIKNENLHLYYDTIFDVSGTIVDKLKIQVGKRTYDIWSFDESVRKRIEQTPTGTPVQFIGEFGEYKGNIQFIIRDARWIKQGVRPL